MKTKLPKLCTVEKISEGRKFRWLAPIMILIIALSTVSQLMASNVNTNVNSNVSTLSYLPQLIKSYKISDASTVNKSCFPTKGEGVIFQRGLGGNCGGLHHIWRVKDELIFNEYDDDTATIKGSVIDDDGKTGIVNIKLSDKVQTGNTWPAQCYENGISDPRELYRDFNGNITINGISFTVNPISSGQHYIVADGAGFEPGEFGIGGWTGGSFGSCTEWFGKLEEIEIRCDVTANAGIDVSIAFGDSTTLTATGGGSYIWSTGETTASITVIPTVTTTYSVMVTSTDGDCTDADQVIVTVDCVMEADLGDDLQFCNENETILTANVTNVPTYAKIITAYNITDADTSTGICANVHGNEQGVILQRNNPLFPITGRYNAWRVYDGLVLNEYDNQTAKIEGSVIDENGNVGIVDILLFDKQNQGLSWLKQCYLDGMVGPQLFYQSFHGTITVNGLIYTVEPKNTGQHFILAEGASLEPNQFGFGAWTAGTFGAGGEWFGNLDPIDIEDCEAVTYLWSTGETTESITVNKSGEYTLTVKTCNNCEATDTIKVDFNKVTANAGADKTICAGESITLSVAGDGTYLWSTGATTQSIEVSPTATTTYSVTVTKDNCEATDEVIVNVNNASANAGADKTICAGESTTLSVAGDGTYLWSTGATTQSIEVSPTATTTYSVTVTKNNCEATDEVIVNVNSASANAGADKTICAGETITLSVAGDGTYLWSTGATTQSIEVSPTATTTYSVTVTKDNCEATDEVIVNVNSASANAGADKTICAGESTTLSVDGDGTYLWSTGETTKSIVVSPAFDSRYTVTVTNNNCEATDDIIVTVNKKISIGDYVWLDENNNGRQDDGATGVNGVTVTLYQCATGSDSGALITTTKTADGVNGAGYYQFEVCPNSGEYYIVFSDIPEELKFTEANAGNESDDSNANEAGKTDCFTIKEENVLTIDAGLKDICDINVSVSDEQLLCAESYSTVDLTATIVDNANDCPGGCVYPILDQDRCFGPTGNFEIWLNSEGGISSWKFKASEQRFERLANGDAKYAATASNGEDTIVMDVTFSGYTTTPTLGSPKLNDCQDYDTADWEYWTIWTGTITSEKHGVFTLSLKGAPFQIGVGADVTRSGFGASGWFDAVGGDGFYTTGDVNIPLAECQENGVEYKWSTLDGNIIGDPYRKTITVDKPGVYVFEALNCKDCFATDKVEVKSMNCGKDDPTPIKAKMATAYPNPVQSGGTLTVEFGKTTSTSISGKSTSTSDESFGPKLEEEVTLMVYDMHGRLISVPRTFKMIDGKATVYLDIDSIPTGKYIVRAQGNGWSESKHILVK